MENDDTAVQYAIGRSDTVAPGTGIDLEFDADVQTMSPEASEYETCYVTSHKGPCRVATYSRDGQLIATGSADASIKILDTERMLAKSAMPIEVRCLAAHRLPLWLILISIRVWFKPVWRTVVVNHERAWSSFLCLASLSLFL